jgi:hypothetical protein
MLASSSLLVASIAAAAASAAQSPPEVAEIARLVHVEPIVEALHHEKNPAALSPLRDELTRRVLLASLEADSAIAQVHEERSVLVDLMNAIGSERDARVGILTVAAGVFAAGAAVGTGMTLNDKTTTAGIWMTTITSGIGAVLTIYAALAPGAGTPSLHTHSNLLAPFFEQPLVFGSYPEIVWAYLSSAAPGENLTRKDRLVAQWKRLGLVPNDGSPEARRRLGAFTRPILGRHEVDLDLLQQRSLMLGDVQAQIALMKQALLRLLEATSNEQPARFDAR